MRILFFNKGFRTYTWLGRVVLTAFCVLIVSVKSGFSADGDGNFYKLNKEGWYWYQEPPEKEEKEKDKKKEESPSPPVAAKDTNPWTMPVEDFKKLMEEKRNLAIQKPSEANTLEYLKLEEVARKKATAFSNVRMLVLQKHPELSVDNETPMGGPGLKAKTLLKMDEIKQTIDGASEDFALVYFVDANCPLCDQQDQIMGLFLDKYPMWSLKRVFASENLGLAAKLNVNTVPFLLTAYRKTGDYIPIGTGVIAVSDIEQTLHRSIRYLRGEITAEQFSLFDSQLGGASDPTMPK